MYSVPLPRFPPLLSYGGASAITGDSASSVTGAGDDVALADGDDDWVDGGDDGDDACVCLFCEQQAPTSAACYAHMAAAHKVGGWLF